MLYHHKFQPNVGKYAIHGASGLGKCKGQLGRSLGSRLLWPIGSMYGIFTYIWLVFMVNVGKYSIHGCYGWVLINHVEILFLLCWKISLVFQSYLLRFGVLGVFFGVQIPPHKMFGSLGHNRTYWTVLSDELKWAFWMTIFLNDAQRLETRWGLNTSQCKRSSKLLFFHMLGFS